MTVSTTLTQIGYVGNGLNTVFPFTFQAFEGTVRAVVDGVVYAGAHTVTLNANQDSNPGGTYTFDAGYIPALDAQIIIERVNPLTQLTDYPPYTRFPAKDHEDALDKLTMIAQEQLAAIVAFENRQILSGDTQTLTITDPTLADDVIINTITNVPFGLLKLDDQGLIDPSQVPVTGGNEFPGDNPSDPIGGDPSAAIIIGTVLPETEPSLAIGPSVIQTRANQSAIADLEINPFGGDVTIGSEAAMGLTVYDNGPTLIYQEGNLTVSFATAFTNLFNTLALNNNGIVGLKQGSFGPGGTDLSLAFNGDADTGITSPAANILQIVAGADNYSLASALNLYPDFLILAAGSSTIAAYNSNHGSNADEIVLSTAGTPLAIFDYDGVRLNSYSGTNVVRTEEPGAGGCSVNNTLTGTGFERVLTESDLPAADPDPVRYLPLLAQISKTSDTTFQQIPEFSFLADADSDYAVTGLLLISNSGGGSGGGKFNIFSDVTINTTGQVTWSQPTSTNNFSESQNGGGLSVNFPATIASVGVQVSLNLVVRNSISGVQAPISMYFAQNASDPVPSVLLLGSYIQVKKLVPPQIVSPLAFAHNDAPYVSIYDQNDNWTELEDLPSPPTGNGRGIDYNNDNSLLAVGHFNSPFLSVYSVFHDYYKLPNVASLPENRVSHLEFSPDGSMLACAIFGSTPYIAIYNTTTWARLANPGTLPTGNANSVSWSPDGNYLAVTFAAAPYCHVYETATWTLVGSPAGITANSFGCSFSPDSSLLAVTSDAPQVRVYNVPALTLVQALTVPSTLRVYHCDWKPDQSELAVGRSSNNTLTIYETSGWTFTEVLAGAEECFNVSYSPDGAYIATCQAGKNRIYETVTYTEVDVLNPPSTNYAFSAAWGNP